MTIEWQTLLISWTFRPGALLLTGIVVWLYGRGYRQKTKGDSALALFPKKFGFSMVIFLLALVSPLNSLARHFFFIHVTQHLLLISLFPAAFMAADPLPVIFAGLPADWQKSARRRFKSMEQAVVFLTPKGVCWFIFVATVWLWYDPTLHGMTLQSPLLYDVAIFTMMCGASLHWWHVTAASPRLHARLPGFTHMGYTLIGAAPLKIPGIAFLFAYLPFYSYPAGVFLGYELDPLQSQQLGGIIIWSLGGVVYSTTAVSFLSSWLSIEADKPEQPRPAWDNDEAFIAPHLE